jgi:ribonuclease P protein component
VLAKANRVTTADEFRAVVRRGRRHAAPEAVYYRLAREGGPLRFGFIVSRAVGGAVERNRLRRRMRAVGREFVDAGRAGEDVVVRALPGSAQLSWRELSSRMRAELAR